MAQEKERKGEVGEISNGTIRDYSGYVKNYFGFFNGLDVRAVDLEKLSDFKDTLSRVSIKTKEHHECSQELLYLDEGTGSNKRTPGLP